MKIPFIQAAQWQENTRGHKKRAIVLHSMEAPEKGSTAEAVANYFKTLDRPASAHVNFDNNSEVQSVQLRDIAYGVPGFNRHAIHLEMAGYARQTRSQWLDEYSMLMIRRVAAYTRTVIIPKFKIEPVWLSDQQIRDIVAGKPISGICTHADCTRALSIRGGHYDPGNGFPRDLFLKLIK